MGPKKILKLSNSTENLTSCKKEESEPIYFVDESLFWLNRLPNEILLSIFNYLSPKDLLSIAQLGSERFFEISLEIKSANFSECFWIPEEELAAFFSRTRTKHITKINFNFLYHVKASHLVNCITKCKQLIDLSVVECGLDYYNIHQIFQCCRKIQVLYWNVNVTRSVMQRIYKSNSKNNSDVPFKNLIKVFINVNCQSHENVDVLVDFLNSCYASDLLQEIYINFTSYFPLSFPMVTETMNVFQLKFPDISQRFFLALDVPNFRHVTALSNIFGCLTKSLKPTVAFKKQIKCILKTLLTSDFRKNEIASSFINRKSHLQLESKSEDISCLSSIPENSISSLVLILNKNVELFNEDFIKKVILVTGKKIKHLCLRSKPDCSPDPLGSNEHLNEISKSPFVVDMVQEVLHTCVNITSLNIVEMHFDVPFSFKVLQHIKNIQVLSIPICAMNKCACEVNRNIKPCAMLEITESTPNVKHFSLYFCVWCRKRFQDADLAFMQHWKKLQHLTVKSIYCLRSCQFLKNIADMCLEFESLEFIEVGHPDVCHYISNIIYILRNCKNFKFLRINQRAFYAAHIPFWKAVEEAHNLQGLCITTFSEGLIQTSVVVNAIKKLKKFHLFHLYASKVSENLHKSVRKSMQANGVENPRVIVCQSPPLFLIFEAPSMTSCKYVHFDSPC